MVIFYTSDISGDTATLSGEEARHCAQVLRKGPGDDIVLVDGRGGWYEGVIRAVSKRSVAVDIQTEKLEYGKLPVRLHLAVAPTKNIGRFEWFLEKATEIGVSEISPILCRRSERKRIRPDRLEKVLLAAMKQSMKAFLPQLHSLRPVEEVIRGENGFIAHCADESDKRHLWHNYHPGEDVTILIGPEGDFHPEEIELARHSGFRAVSLGKQRLRTETAAVAATHIIQLANEVL